MSKLSLVWVVTLILACFCGAACADSFKFVVLGDTTYEIPADEPLYQALIGTINQSSPAFSIHIGDTKGWGDCGNEFQLSQKAFFDSYEQPVFYAPGNNEWADCWRDNRGNHDPEVVMDSMRRIFFGKPQSLGQTSMPMLRQSDTDKSSKYGENARWHHGGVTFTTVNVIGASNNQLLRDEALWREFVAREKANVAWIEAAFAAAREQKDKAIVIAMHSNIFDPAYALPGGPFEAIANVIANNAPSFLGQVLVAHGHQHSFIVDRPLYEWQDEPKGSKLGNVTRLQVHGWPEHKAVTVTVDTDTPWVFGFEPIYAEGNMSADYRTNDSQQNQ